MSSSKEQHHLYKYYVEPQAVSDMTRRTLVLVLAGGEGSRLKNLTKWRAKPAVPFGGKYRIIDFALSNCINSGLRRIGVLTQYKSHSLIRHLQRAWGFMRPEIGEFVEIIPAQQRLRPEWYQGTADAIYQNLDIVYRHEPDYVLILGGDHIYTMNYAKMLAAHVQADAELTVGCIEVPLEEAKSFGVMSVDEEFRITRFTEKPEEPEGIPGKPEMALASMGIYIFSMEFLTKALIHDAEDETSQHDFGKKIIPAQQRLRPEWYQGTADAIYQNLDIIYRHEPDYVLVLGGDHIYTMNYALMLAAHVQANAELTVGCIEVPLEEAKAFGVMSVDEEYRITRFMEKPDEPESIPGKPGLALASMGIYIFSMEFLTKALIHDAEDETSQHDFGKNIIPAAIKHAKSIAYPYLNNRGEPAYWRDVGSLYSYWKANIELCDIEPELNLYERDWPIWTYQTQSPPAKFAFDDEGRRGQAIDSLVAGGCIISGAKVKRSVIFFNTQVETGSYIKESVILPKVRVGRNCKLVRCIVDKGTVIPDGFEVGVNPEEDRKRFLVTDEGIVLVTPGMMNQRLHYERD